MVVNPLGKDGWNSDEGPRLDLELEANAPQARLLGRESSVQGTGSPHSER
jgi:hypothetical protein